MKKLTSAAVLSAMLLAVPAFAGDLLGGGAWAYLTPSGASVLLPAADKALHVTVAAPVKAYYQVELTHDIAAAVPANSTLVYRFFARSPTSSPLHAVIEKRTAPYTKVMDKPLVLSPAWKQYTLTAKVPTAYAAKGLAARLQVGEKKGLIEFKGISVTSAGR